jgi:very-short-patch-repair endonuclease
MTRDGIMKFFFDESGKRIKRRYSELPSEISNFLQANYCDALNLQEAFYMCVHNLSCRPVCITCGKSVVFHGQKKGFAKHCSRQCERKDYVEKLQNELGTTSVFSLDSIKKQIKKTNLEKYGCENPMQNSKIVEKVKSTCLKRYGVQNGGGTKESLEKIKQTNMKKRGVEWPAQNKSVIEKARKNCLEKRGVDWFTKDPEIINKVKETCEKKYGKSTYLWSETYATNFDEYLQKTILTKKMNGTTNSSSIEEQVLDWMKRNKFKFEYQYKCDRYPFFCDFWIEDYDLFIEIQGNWTHGKHPYDEKVDFSIIEQWSEKAKRSDYYNSAIETWTIRDVKKRNIAKQNNLNYLEIFSNDLEECKHAIANKIYSIMRTSNKNFSE